MRDDENDDRETYHPAHAAFGESRDDGTRIHSDASHLGSADALASLDPSPSSVLFRANELLLAQGSSGQFTTVFLATLDIAHSRIIISSAGHSSLAVCGESARFLESPHGTPLGAMRNDYGEAEFDLLPGETIVLYTDGLTEARQGTDLFGERRLLETELARKTLKPGLSDRELPQSGRDTDKRGHGVKSTLDG